MNKPPAFQFYPDNFLGGTAHMTTEEVGAYALLLCYQWNAGHIPPEDAMIRRIARVTQAFDLGLVKSKFIEHPDGLLRNDRLERERFKQIQFREKQRENGKMGGRPKGLANPSLSSGLSQTEAKKSFPSPSPSPLHRESSDRPSEGEVLEVAKMIGLAEWKAKDWFDEMESCGWIDWNHRPVVDYRASLSRVRTKWESDGRPTSPPGQKGKYPAKVFPEAQLREIENQISKHQCNPASLVHNRNAGELERASYRALIKKRDEVKQLIASA